MGFLEFHGDILKCRALIREQEYVSSNLLLFIMSWVTFTSCSKLLWLCFIVLIFSKILLLQILPIRGNYPQKSHLIHTMTLEIDILCFWRQYSHLLGLTQFWILNVRFSVQFVYVWDLFIHSFNRYLLNSGPGWAGRWAFWSPSKPCSSSCSLGLPRKSHSWQPDCEVPTKCSWVGLRKSWEWTLKRENIVRENQKQ